MKRLSTILILMLGVLGVKAATLPVGNQTRSVTTGSGHFVTVTKYPGLDVTQILLTPVFHGMTSYGSVVSSPTFP